MDSTVEARARGLDWFQALESVCSPPVMKNQCAAYKLSRPPTHARCSLRTHAILADLEHHGKWTHPGSKSLRLGLIPSSCICVQPTSDEESVCSPQYISGEIRSLKRSGGAYRLTADCGCSCACNESKAKTLPESKAETLV